MNSKKLIFSVFVIFFIFYSWIVYTSGTMLEGEEVILTESAIRGRDLMLEKNCYACHQIYGMGGFMGPDMTNSYSTRGKDFLYAKIKWGDRKMPDLKLKDSEVYDLIEFLRITDISGVSPAQGYPVPWYNFPRKRSMFANQ